MNVNDIFFPKNNFSWPLTTISTAKSNVLNVINWSHSQNKTLELLPPLHPAWSSRGNNTTALESSWIKVWPASLILIKSSVNIVSLSLPQMQRTSKSALLLPSITLLPLSLPMVKSRLLANSWSKCAPPVLPRYNVSSSIPSLNSCKPPNSWTTRHWANCCNVLTAFAPMESKFK